MHSFSEVSTLFDIIQFSISNLNSFNCSSFNKYLFANSVLVNPFLNSCSLLCLAQVNKSTHLANFLYLYPFLGNILLNLGSKQGLSSLALKRSLFFSLYFLSRSLHASLLIFFIIFMISRTSFFVIFSPIFSTNTSVFSMFFKICLSFFFGLIR